MHLLGIFVKPVAVHFACQHADRHYGKGYHGQAPLRPHHVSGDAANPHLVVTTATATCFKKKAQKRKKYYNFAQYISPM
jgi:hypothetical protein